MQNIRKYYLIFGFGSETAALLLQIYIAFSAKGSGIHTLFKLSTFFTVCSNFLIWLCFLMLFLGNRSFWNKSSTQTALLTYISFVSLIYHLLLQDVWNPQGLQWYVGEMLHWINPLIFLIFWLIFVNKQDLKISQLPYWLLFPIIYFIWVMIFGMLGFGYPYPFLNPEKSGIPKLLLTGVILLVTLSLIGFTYIITGKKLSRISDVKKADSSENHPY